jgi:hypothetical protein
MNVSRFVSVSAVLALLTVSTTVPAAAQQPQMPKPGPEHEMFKMDAGTWDAVIEMSEAPGQKPMTSKGVETNTLGCGGLCLITDFKGEMMPGTSFEGHGVMTWDPAKKAYVGSWTDSMSQGLGISESTWDPKTKMLTGSMEGPDMTGKVVKMRSVVDYSTAGTRVFTLSMPGPDGKEMQALRITYKKRS